MPVAEIIAIGTELLLGEIQDTNTQYLARFLREAGIDLYRTTIIGDNVDRVAQVIQESTKRSQIIITTGGLGPTVDDPTRHAIAQSQGVELEYRSDLWAQIEARFRRFNRQPTENNRRQAYIPVGAIPVENPVGTAPCFIVDQKEFCIISLPGVPREMEYMMNHSILPFLKTRFDLHGTIKARVLHTAGVGESQVDEWVSDLEIMTNPTVGLLAHAGQVDLRITAKAESESEADQLIEKVASDIYSRLGDHIYGENSITLEEVVIDKIDKNQRKLVLYECGLDGQFSQILCDLGFPKQLVFSNGADCSEVDIAQSIKKCMTEKQANYGLVTHLEEKEGNHILTLQYHTPDDVKTVTRSFGGSPELVNPWAINTTLDFLRRNSS